MRPLIRFFVLVLVASAAVLVAAMATAFIQHEFLGKGKTGGPNHVAVIDINGVIITANNFLKELKEITERPNVKAIVVRINSPGGIVAPSQEMYEALKKADEKIPVVISMGALAASGGYYAAMGGRQVFASPGTLTASIGVIMEFVNTEKLHQWAKIERQTLKAGKFKDVGSPVRPMKPEEKELLQAMLNNIHSQFKDTVQERRKLTDEEIEKWCDGRVMTGEQAKEAHLVDTLGGFEDALKEAKKIAKLPEDASVDFPESRKGLLREMLIGEETESKIDKILSFLGSVDTLAGISPGWKVMYLSPMR